MTENTTTPGKDSQVTKPYTGTEKPRPIIPGSEITITTPGTETDVVPATAPKRPGITIPREKDGDTGK